MLSKKQRLAEPSHGRSSARLVKSASRSPSSGSVEPRSRKEPAWCSACDEPAEEPELPPGKFDVGAWEEPKLQPEPESACEEWSLPGSPPARPSSPTKSSCSADD